MLRIAIGSLMQESNTFVPTRTTRAVFESSLLLFGDDVLAKLPRAKIEISGFVDVLRAAGADVVPTMAANAVAGGVVERETFNDLLGEIIQRLRAALPLDGVLLALHGAMVVDGEPDAESAILAAVRAVVGAGVPIVATLDLHAHLTTRMVEISDALVGYREYPHTDMYETGVRAAKLLLDRLAGTVTPTMALAKCPLLVSPVNARTANEPLKSIVYLTREIERQANILHVAVFPVQPWLDVPDLGFGVLVVADNDPAAAEHAAREIADRVWDARADFEPDLTPLDNAIRIAFSSPGLTVVGDAGDAPSGGSAADSTAVLRALLQAGADRAARLTYVTLCDAEAATFAAQAGEGHEVALSVGHKVSVRDGVPLHITGRVIAVSEGSYRATGAAYSGTIIHMGLTAVIAIGSIRLCLRSNPATEWDTGIYASLGLNPQAAALIFVKSPSHFRAAFEPLADRLLIADTPGPTCPNMRRLAFQHVTRPLYPLDHL